MSQTRALPKLHFAPRERSRPGSRSGRAERGAKAASGTADASVFGRVATRRASRWTGTRLRSPLVAAGSEIGLRSTQRPLREEADLGTPRHLTEPAPWRFLCRTSRRVATLRKFAAGNMVVQLLPALAAHRCFTRQCHADGPLVDRDHPGRTPTPGTALAEPRRRDLAGGLQPVRFPPGPEDSLQSSDLRPARARRLLLSGPTALAPLFATLLKRLTRRRSKGWPCERSDRGRRLLLRPC